MIDAGSNDGTVELLKEQEEKFTKKDYQFKWLSEKYSDHLRVDASGAVAVSSVGAQTSHRNIMEYGCGEIINIVRFFYPPSQKTMGVSPWLNAKVGPSEARIAKKGLSFRSSQAKEDASADSAEEMKDTTGVSPWRLHFFLMDLLLYFDTYCIV